MPRGSEGKASACNAGDLGSIPGSGRFPGEGNGNPLQYCCLENPLEEEPDGLQSMGLQIVRHDSATSLLHFILTMDSPNVIDLGSLLSFHTQFMCHL